jgi:hypothetical protein
LSLIILAVLLYFSYKKRHAASINWISFGIVENRVSGSHYVLIKDKLRAVVPYHKSVKIGTLKSILN